MTKLNCIVVRNVKKKEPINYLEWKWFKNSAPMAAADSILPRYSPIVIFIYEILSCFSAAFSRIKSTVVLVGVDVDMIFPCFSYFFSPCVMLRVDFIALPDLLRVFNVTGDWIFLRFIYLLEFVSHRVVVISPKSTREYLVIWISFRCRITSCLITLIWKMLETDFLV